ncbi:FitA-like ribbon-helix-helix domain-containing protein [Microbacterium algeriense]|uniref:FitA-like ribbon-helix-helix domain-containing protein n=1 Tax=Microbacterium algeriense TaxID=2615184 RepID=UPI0029B50CA8|nr:hypothetical protein [Microbacterium algeriense]MDX2398949.1 hypothetical protein [Microbacterium algeriense]
MATVTIRNLSDDIVVALKERARRNSRSMEAEVRDLLTRVAQEAPSALEAVLAEQVARVHRWSLPASEVVAWVEANPETPEEERIREEWAIERRAERRDPLCDESIRDPWEDDAPA